MRLATAPEWDLDESCLWFEIPYMVCSVIASAQLNGVEPFAYTRRCCWC